MLDDFVDEHIMGRHALTQEQVDLINRIKMLSGEVGLLVQTMGGLPYVSPKWLSIGEASVQQGMMSLVRSVAEAEHG